MFQHALKFLTWFSACRETSNIVLNTMVPNIGEFQNSTFLFQIFMFESVLKISEHVEICNAC